MKPALPVLAALLVALAAAPVWADAIGVIIVPTGPGDVALADNLTEVAMARIAETPGRTLVGTDELRRRLGAESGRDLNACLERPACLSRVAVSLGVARLVTGAIRAERKRFFLNLNLTDVAPGRLPATFFREVDGSLADVIRAAQQGVDELLDPARAPGQLLVRSRPEGAWVMIDDQRVGTTPVASGPLRPGPHHVRVEADRRFAWKSVIQLEPGGRMELELGERELPPRRLWAPYVAYGAAGGAALSLGAGGVLGMMARGTPVGNTRADAQMDRDRRLTYGRLSTGLLVSGAALGVASALVSWRCWRDIVAD